MGELVRLSSSSGRYENVEPDVVSSLKGNPFAVRRPARIQVISGGRELRNDVEPRTVRWRSAQLDAFLGQPEERKPPVCGVDVSTPDAVDGPAWHAAKRRDLPNATLHGS